MGDQDQIAINFATFDSSYFMERGCLSLNYFYDNEKFLKIIHKTRRVIDNKIQFELPLVF